MVTTSGFFPGAVSGALRAAGQIEIWDAESPDPLGFRHWESGVYKAAAKGSERLIADGLVGGFDAQRESGVAASFGNTFVDSSGFTTPTLALTFNLGEINSHPDSFFNLMVEDGSIDSDFKAFNMKFWIDDDNVFRDKGYQPQWFYLQQSGWDRNIQLSSGTANALPLPSSLPELQNTFVNGTNIFSSGSYIEDQVSNYIYTMAHFPAHASGYELGTYGGVGVSGFQFKMSYEWTGIEAATRSTDATSCLAGEAVIPTPPEPVDPIASGLQDDVKVYWNLDESSGTRLDSVGSLDLSEIGTVGVSSGGGPDGNDCVILVGNASNYLSRADNADLTIGNRDFTLAGWVYIDSLAVNQSIMSKYTNTGNQKEYLIDYIASSRTRLVTSPDGVGSFSVAEDFTSMSAATWHFVVIWHDSTGNTVNIQIDNGTAVSDATITPFGVFDGSQDFRLGNYADLANPLSGRLSRWGVWHKILSADEKTTLYNSGDGIDYPFI